MVNIGGNRSIPTRYTTDIITIARAWCVAKDWGYLRIGVQYGDETTFFLGWNFSAITPPPPPPR
jgi:hypothetical protein